MRLVNYTLIFVFCSTLCTLSFCETLKAPESPTQLWNPPAEKAEGASLVYPSYPSDRIGVESQHPLNLIDLLDIALRNNPTTREAWENALSAEAEKKQAESAYYPGVTISASANRQKTVSTLEAYGIRDSSNVVYNPAVTISYLVFDFGGRSAQLESAAQTLLSTNFQFNQTFHDILFQVESSYYTLYGALAELEAVEANLENAKTSLDATQQRLKVGVGTKLEVLQAKSNYYEVLYSLADAEGQIKTAKGNLADALGMPASTDIKISTPPKNKQMALEKEDVGRLINDAFAKRPDLSSLRATLKAREADIRAANSDLLPNLNLGASYNKNWYDYFGTEPSSGNDYSYAGFLTVNWDIFDGFYNINKKRSAEAKAEAMRAKLANAELSASTDVWTKYYNLRTANKKLKFSKASLNTSSMSYDLALTEYHAGLNSILDLLQSQSDLSDARSKLVQSQRDLFIAVADLYHSIGVLYVDMPDLSAGNKIVNNKKEHLALTNYTVRDK